MDEFFRNFSCWTEPIHWVLHRNFLKFWLYGSRPWSTFADNSALFPSDVIDLAMCPFRNFGGKQFHLFDVMWPRSNQWERALLGRNFHHGYENLLIYAFKKFWFWQSRLYVRPPYIHVAGVKFCISSTPRGKSHGPSVFKREKKSNKAQSFLEREIISCAARISENFRFKDEDDYEYEISLKVFWRIPKIKTSRKTSFYHFSREKLAMLPLVKEVTPSPNRKMIKLLIFDNLFPPLRHSP